MILTMMKSVKEYLFLQSAVVGLHLKSGNSRTDLTIIYFYWNEHKRRLMACVAELKSHLVKQIQVMVHVVCAIYIASFFLCVCALFRVVYMCCNRAAVAERDLPVQML